MKIKILYILSITIIFMLGGHFLDLGDLSSDYNKDLQFFLYSEHLSNKYQINSKLGNGFFEIDSRKIYHIGFYTMYFAFFTLLITYINLSKTMCDKKEI